MLLLRLNLKHKIRVRDPVARALSDYNYFAWVLSVAQLGGNGIATTSRWRQGSMISSAI